MLLPTRLLTHLTLLVVAMQTDISAGQSGSRDDNEPGDDNPKEPFTVEQSDDCDDDDAVVAEGKPADRKDGVELKQATQPKRPIPRPLWSINLPPGFAATLQLAAAMLLWPGFWLSHSSC